MSIGENVKRIMAARKIRQNELARMIGMSSSGMSTALAPDANPRENTIRAIAQALGCSVGELFGEDSASAASQGITAQEKELLDIFRQLTSEGQSLLIRDAYNIISTPSMRKNVSMSSMG